MNRLLYYFVCTVLLASRSDYSTSGFDLQSYSNPFTTLPAGEYRIYVKAIFNCNTITRDDKIYFDLKTSGNIVKGNGTLIIPLDDTIAMELNFAYRDPTNGWKDNAFVQKSPKACTTVKNLAGNDWPKFVNDSGITNTNCPISAGNYMMKHLDISKYTETNFSKTFIYGTYKIRIQFSRKNVVLGCLYVVVELKRP